MAFVAAVKEWLQRNWPRHRGKMVGTAAGLFVAILIMLVGLFWTLFLLLLAGTGFLVGSWFDDDENLGEVLDRIWSQGRR